MKYESRSDLLIAAGESIKMQEYAGIEPVCKMEGSIYQCTDLTFSSRQAIYEFPLAVVDGKAVFVGDALYSEAGIEYTVSLPRESELTWLQDPKEPMLYGERNGKTFFCQLKNARTFSLVPPKTRTVMVELLREDAKEIRDLFNRVTNIHIAIDKALEADK